MPPAIQTTSAYSPDFQIAHNRDTRPAFLGGQYTSKIQGRSEVSQYISKTLATKKEKDKETINQKQADAGGKEGYDVASYYKAKLRMRNSLERAFASQVHQYHHEKKKGHKPNQLSSLMQDQGDIELPSIATPNEKIRNTAPSDPNREPLQLPPSAI